MYLKRVPTTKVPATAPVERAQPDSLRVPAHGAHNIRNPERASIPLRETSGSFVLSRPTTITVTIPAAPTRTSARPSTSSTASSDTTSLPTSSSSPVSPSSEPTSSRSTSTSSSSRLFPTPSISVYNKEMPIDSPTSETSSLSPSPTGSASPIGALRSPLPGAAIAGIVIAATVIISVAIVFAVRMRLKANRRRRRLSAWSYPNRGGGLSTGDGSEHRNTTPSQQGFAERFDTGSTVMTEGLYASTRPSISMMHKTSHSASSRSVMTPTAMSPASTSTSQAPPVPSKNKSQIPLPPVPIPTVSNTRASTISTKRMTAAEGVTISLFPHPSTVISTFIPTQPDEMSIETGEIVRVLAEYDDGWTLCCNALGERGMVPLECLDRGANDVGGATSGLGVPSLEAAKSPRRTSSLGMPKQT